VQVCIAPEPDTVMSSIVGWLVLKPLISGLPRQAHRARQQGIAGFGGKLMMDAVKRHGTELIPVDSEHNAPPSLRADSAARRLSSSSRRQCPFRTIPKKPWRVTPADALNHPTWKMGNRITIDSATLMNKGFEVIEHWLFDFAPEDIEVVVHPQRPFTPW